MVSGNMIKPEEFNDWYTDIVENAGMCDKRYPVKGMNIWTGYGWKTMQLIDRLIRNEFDSTGHDEVHFPLLIPETEFKKEEEHIQGFGSQVFWVTHAGDNELDVKLLLRPTSETAMYPIFSLWVRSHSDLPLKTYQIVNVFRYETKQTRAFMRVREIHFFEAHTCHESFEDAEKQIAEDLEIMKRLARNLCLPYLMCKRPDWDKFAGAFYTIGIDSLMPTGRTLQMGSIHQYKENFSRPYDIKFENIEGGHDFVHQTTYGMSERILGALIAIHGDDKGIVLPPMIAPIQAVIIPIPSKGNLERIDEEARAIYSQLKGAGVRVHLDNRDIRPGKKFFDWELKGVPLRLELGMRDIENGVITFSQRVKEGKYTVNKDELIETTLASLDQIQKDLFDSQNEKLKNSITHTDDLGNVVGGVNSMHWCGETSCGESIEEGTDMAVLGIPQGVEMKDGQCIVCGNPTSTVVYVSKTY